MCNSEAYTFTRHVTKSFTGVSADIEKCQNPSEVALVRGAKPLQR